MTEGLEAVRSSLPLQMCAYFNVVFLPAWAAVFLDFFAHQYWAPGALTRALAAVTASTVFCIEGLRLYMLYAGNLGDKLGVLPVLSQSVLLILLLLEIGFGYVALRFTAAQQALKHARSRQDKKADAPQ
uniref:Transmembrane protein 17B n=1 Tax=Dendroctonus ponderosae TaxID=77166 RepID=A0AAR5P3C2_DENPD